LLNSSLLIRLVIISEPTLKSLTFQDIYCSFIDLLELNIPWGLLVGESPPGFIAVSKSIMLVSFFKISSERNPLEMMCSSHCSTLSITTLSINFFTFYKFLNSSTFRLSTLHCPSKCNRSLTLLSNPNSRTPSTLQTIESQKDNFNYFWFFPLRKL